MPRRRAVLFDLDDTLYPLRRFVLSGFRAVAAHVERTRGIERHRVFAALTHASTGPSRGRELQALAERFDLPEASVRRWVDVIRDHRPVIRLPRHSALALRRLRVGWRLAIVTNGRPDIQARKVEALGLARAVDAVIFANEYGTGRGKPEAAPFLAALERLDVPADRAVFVGDDETCDLVGASRVGMHTVWYRPGAAPGTSRFADEVVGSLLTLPRVASALVGANSIRGMRHVA